MLLILTNSQDATANYLVPILVASNIPLVRLDTDKLLGYTSISYRPGNPILTVGADRLLPQHVRNIWYRRPEHLSDERFSDSPEGRYAINEWSEAIEGFLAHVPKSRWMNHPSANALASHKVEQLTTAKSFGLLIPDTLVTQDAAEARAFFDRHDAHVVVKPMSNGYIVRDGQNDSLIYTNRVERHHLDLAHDLIHCPTLFQQLIRKRCDVRITVVEDALHAVELRAKDEDGFQRCDIRRNNMSDVQYTETKLPQTVGTLLRRFVTHYGLRFAAIDMVIDLDGEWYFLEVNPNGQWAWLDIAAGMTIGNSFVKAFANV